MLLSCLELREVRPFSDHIAIEIGEVHVSPPSMTISSFDIGEVYRRTSTYRTR